MRTLTGISGLAVLLLSLVLSGQARADGITVITGTSAPPAARSLAPAPAPAPPVAAGGSYVAVGAVGCDRTYRAWEGSFHGDGEPGRRSDEDRRDCRSGRHAVIGYEGGRYGDWRYRVGDDDEANRAPAPAAPTVASVPEAAPVEPCGPETTSASVGGAAWTVEGSSCPGRPRVWQLTPPAQD